MADTACVTVYGLSFHVSSFHDLVALPLENVTENEEAYFITLVESKAFVEKILTEQPSIVSVPVYPI
jgi:hypothetical protein